MSRRRFTEREIVTVLLKQGAIIYCPRCKKPIMLGHTIEREHFIELAMGGLDDISNCFFSHKECHHIATNGTKATTLGSSKHTIAKDRRMNKEPSPRDLRVAEYRKQRREWAKKIKAERTERGT